MMKRSQLKKKFPDAYKALEKMEDVPIPAEFELNSKHEKKFFPVNYDSGTTKFSLPMRDEFSWSYVGNT